MAKLTDTQIKNAKCPKDQKQTKLFDENGLYLLVTKKGSKLWRKRYKFGGKDQLLALGKYPLISLKKARELTNDALILLSEGTNPMEARKSNKRAVNTDDKGFRVVGLKWWDQNKNKWSDEHAKRVKRWITVDAKILHSLSIDKIDAGHITEVMLSIESSGHPKKAPPILSVINRIFGFALAHRLTRSNPAQGFPLSDIIKPLPPVKSHSAIVKPSELANLLRDIDTNEYGDYCSIEALKLIPRVFLRPIEVRVLKWEYINFESKLIYIPAGNMKGAREHLVPLAKQVIYHLKQIHEHSSYSPYLFPNSKDSNKPMSKNVLTNRLRDLGYTADVMSAHGFRSTASTILHEQGWHHDVIETQLAHLTGTATSRAYNRAKYLPERKEMMQAWADYLDKIKVQ